MVFKLHGEMKKKTLFYGPNLVSGFVIDDT